MAKKSRAFDHSNYENWIDPNETIPYERNVKKHDEKQLKAIVKSINDNGWQQDVVLTRDNVVVIGHGRRLAALEIGCEMPYHRVDKDADQLTKKEIRRLRYIDNKINAMTGFDFTLESIEIEDLDFDGYEFDTANALDPSALDDLFAPAEEKPPKEPEQIQCPHCKMWFTP